MNGRDDASQSETLYLCSIPGMVESIKESEKEPLSEMMDASELDFPLSSTNE